MTARVEHPAFPKEGPALQSPAEYHRLARGLRETVSHDVAARVAVLSTWTTSTLEPFLQVELARLGLPAALFFGGFGQIESLLLDAQSTLHQFDPDVAVIAMRLEDVSPDACWRLTSMSGSELDTAFDGLIERIESLLSNRANGHRCRVLVANFSPSVPSILGIGDASLAASRSAATARANGRLVERLSRYPGAHIWDYAGLVSSVGAAEWEDARLWAIGRIPVAAKHQGKLARHLSRTIRASLVPATKVLVLDLDNTIWGGVIGDDGMDGIKLGDEFPGSVFKTVQRRALSLRDRGVLLAVASKNDLEVARRAFESHPEMLIRWSDLAAVRINWQPKSVSIRELAEELSLGLDAFAVLDDNPLERAEIAAALPTVKIIDFEPWGSLERALAESPWFDQLTTSSEDLMRADLYARDRLRRELSTTHTSVDDFLRSLEMRAVAGAVTAVDRARVTQLIAKTNQFNLSGIRYSEAEIATRADQPDQYFVCALRLSDRFGDQGLIAAAVLERREDSAHIDTLVMSCRVMNRHAEFALLSCLADAARAWGCRAVTGAFVASGRNGPAEGLLASTGFEEIGQTTKERSYSLRLTDNACPWPSMIQRMA